MIDQEFNDKGIPVEESTERSGGLPLLCNPERTLPLKMSESQKFLMARTAEYATQA